jgi:hypothetical protein
MAFPMNLFMVDVERHALGRFRALDGASLNAVETSSTTTGAADPVARVVGLTDSGDLLVI